jgi:hypothetical protein
MSQFYSKPYDEVVAENSEHWKFYSRRNIYNFIANGKSLSINNIIQDHAITSAIDYGCGAGISMSHCTIPVFNFDPFVERFSQYPTEPADMLVAFNVLNVIEDQFFDAVITEFYRLCNRIVVTNTMLPGVYKRDTSWYVRQLLINHSQEFKIAAISVSDEPESPDSKSGRQRLYFMLEKIPA